MIDRFQGEALVEQLREQKLIEHDEPTASAFADATTLRQYQPGEAVITQGDQDNDILFVLVGTVDVEVHGSKVATRCAGEHVGEMALIDRLARRSATVRATSLVIVARVSSAVFVQTADARPRIWQRLALELSRRLQQRGTLVKPTRERPVVFVGSTVAKLPIARALQKAFEHDRWLTRLWTDDVFSAGKSPMDSLVAQLPQVDFGLLIVTNDDKTISGDLTLPSPRDNIVFELGLLLGALGPSRTFMVRVRGESQLKLPSDLLGVTALEILPGTDGDLASRVGPAATEFRGLFNQHYQR